MTVKNAVKQVAKLKRGFTLIELLVVVLIIGILAAVAVPQYQKAVTKARFAEAITNLSTIGKVDAACQLNKGAVCKMDELDVDVGEYVDSESRSTPYFVYAASSSANMTPIASFRKEDVCLCYLETGEIVIMQDDEESTCSGDVDASMDYATLLTLRKVTYEECGCC